MRKRVPVQPMDRPYWVVMLGADILLDDSTWIDLDDCGTVAAPRPIATFSSYVAAMRAAARVNGPASPWPRVPLARPHWVD